MDQEAAIRRLRCWRGSISIEPLPGGITNVNFKVRDAAGATYAVRAGSDDRLLGIDRRAELTCARLAARLGVGPEVVDSEPPWTVAAFVAGTPLTPELLAGHDRLRRIGSLLRRLHGARRRLAGHLPWFSPFLAVRTYLELAAERGYHLPVDPAALRRRIDALEAAVAPFLPAFCHNDLMPGNLIDDGDRVWLIDWEYAGIGHPLFDLAGLASNAALDAEAEAALLAAYLEGSDADADAARRQVSVLRPIAALREALWAVIQGARSAIAFDYAGYRDDNLAAFDSAYSAAAPVLGVQDG